MKRRYLILLCGLAAATCRCEAAYAIAVEKSACEMLENPLCVEPHALRFGWQLRSDKAGDRQTAYHLLVASSREQLDGNVGDLWDSRKVPSPQSQRLPYGGAALQAGARCHWKVMAWGADGDSSAWSEPATFDLAPLINEVNVRWIGAIKKAGSRLPEGRGYNPPFKQHGHDTLFAKVDTLAKRSILLRKQFDVKKPVARAMLYASGLGHYELRLNGQRVGKSVFAPLWSDYDKTVYYNAYDVSAMLQQGSNALGAWLGNGFYNCSESSRYRKLLVSFGPPTMFLALRVEYADGSTATVSSDRTWRYAPSPITYNSIYGGEDYDANLEQAGWDTPAFDDSGWRSAVVQESPQGRLRPQLAPSVEVMQQFGVARWWRPQENTLVLDMGQNLSGMPTISVKGKKGQVVRLYPAECLTADSLANQKRTGSPYYFEYTLRGDEEGEAWTPRFSYYGYQYLQAE
ncbi:MAG: family 78 glycoside hydrolase catalytic domain, partial [Prevotellaceae bacterium]|nr:family 78 glycoside hydrolase catalytic domain [Prevotellaceae bacterium]